MGGTTVEGEPGRLRVVKDEERHRYGRWYTFAIMGTKLLGLSTEDGVTGRVWYATGAVQRRRFYVAAFTVEGDMIEFGEHRMQEQFTMEELATWTS